MKEASHKTPPTTYYMISFIWHSGKSKSPGTEATSEAGGIGRANGRLQKAQGIFRGDAFFIAIVTKQLYTLVKTLRTYCM